MISRRKMLKGGAAAAVIASVPFIRPRRAFAQSTVSFDYFISPKGDDNNAGSLASPWSITALNSKQSIYAGKKIGIIGDQGVIQSGTVGGVQTTLYSIYQTLNNNTNILLSINGGTAGSPTYLGSCNSSGAYTARIAIIDCAQPGTGSQPTAAGSIMGQSQVGGPGNVANYGYVTVDGLVIRNFTAAALNFYCGSPRAENVTIKNCEIYNGQNVQSNGNPGAIYTRSADNLLVTNCRIHDLKTNAAGSSSNYQHMGTITFDSYNTNITNCTYYNCNAVSSKDGWQQMNVSYCYLGWGTFGSPYAGGQSGVGGTVQNYLTGTGMTNLFHHNILLGPLLGWGESSQWNEGLVKVYNNTFYEPQVGGTNTGISTLYNIKGNSGGKWNFYNNLVYSLQGYVSGNASGALALYNVNSTPSILPMCDYNAYGSGMNFSGGYGVGPWSLATWQGFGFDVHSKTLSSSPFVGTPAEGITGTFAITGPATTAGVGGVACGAMDGSGLVGCDFGAGPVPMAPALRVS